MAADGTDIKKSRLWQQEYDLFSRCYRGRTDWVGVRKNGIYKRASGGLTYERFKEHMALINTYALYQMDASGKVSFCLFDLDVLPRKQPWEILVEKIELEKEKTRPPHVKGRAASEHTLSRSVADFSSARILA